MIRHRAEAALPDLEAYRRFRFPDELDHEPLIRVQSETAVDRLALALAARRHQHPAAHATRGELEPPGAEVERYHNAFFAQLTCKQDQVAARFDGAIRAELKRRAGPAHADQVAVETQQRAGIPLLAGDIDGCGIICERQPRLRDRKSGECVYIPLLGRPCAVASHAEAWHILLER